VAKKIPPQFLEVMEAHAQRMRRLTDQRGVARLKSIYDDAYATLHSRLKQVTRAGWKDSFTAYQHRVVLAQLKVSQANLAGRLVGELKDVTKEAQVEAIRANAQDVRRLEKHFTGAAIQLPVDETARLNQLVQLRRPMLDEMHRKAIIQWGANTFEKVNRSLVKSMAMQLTTDEAIDELPGAAEREWWQGERIVRTETAWAYNASTTDTLKEASEILPDLKMRWTELVDDDTYEPLDPRVSVDSIAMHGQVATPGTPFRMPARAPAPDEKGNTEVPESLVGKTWLFPPNRPNDRSRLLPWRAHWGIPGWELRGGRRIEL
jgi:hypothetical protein